MIRKGIVSSIDPERKMAKVFFPVQNVVSQNMVYLVEVQPNDSVLVAFLDDSAIEGVITANLTQTGGTSPGDTGTTYIYTQLAPSDVWTIEHTLNKFPSVTIVDSAGTQIIGDVVYISNTLVQVVFSNIFAGKAFLN